jgi:aminoglycoside phosphotransferase (APT) family kinase protein
LHAIHNVTLDDVLAARLPAFALRTARTLAQPYAGDPICRRIHQTLSRHTSTAIDRPCLLHGDFWPGNVLWQAGRITAVLDWEDAAMGDPLADVANCRLELLWAFGPAAMRAFTQHYAECDAAVNMAHLPVHDLRAAVGPALKMNTWGLAPRREAAMRAALAAFVDSAIASLT